jgi:hypothetical protein
MRPGHAERQRPVERQEIAAVIGLGIIAIGAGIVLAWAAVAGWRGRLSRDGPVGVRTPSTMRSDEAFATTNKAAAPLGSLEAASWPWAACWQWLSRNTCSEFRYSPVS